MSYTKHLYWLTPDGLHQLEAWARDGLTDRRIARRCGVARCTLYVWRSRYPQIASALERGRDARIIEHAKVENALLKRARGYNYTVEEVRVKRAPDGQVIDRRVLFVTKHMPPDTEACLWWLCNRCPDRWRRKPTGDNTAAALDRLDELLRGIGGAMKG